MSTFNVTISCLTVCRLPWFVELTFQIPIQNYSLQHQTLLSPPQISTTEHQSLFGPDSSFFLELLVIAHCSSSVAYWNLLTWGGGCSCSGVVSFCLFILFMGFLQQEYWNGLQFPTSMDHVLSQLFTMTCLSWVALHGMAHIFIELCKPLHHDKVVIHERDPLGCWYFIWNLNFSQSHSRRGKTASCLQ